MASDDADNNIEGDGSASNTLRIKIAELEHRLREEKDRFEFLQLEACQGVEKHTRDCSSLRENVGRLEEDCVILRDRELRDRERIKGLMEEIERKERVFREKFVELKLEIKDLECANIRAQNEACEWKKKFLELEERIRLGERVKEFENAELEARALRIVGENFQLLKKEAAVAQNAKGKEGAIEVDEEMPKRSAWSMQKTSEENLVLTPELTRKRVLKGVDSDSEGDNEEDRIPIGQLVRMKPPVEVSDVPEELYVPFVNQSSGCNGVGDSTKPPRKKLSPRKMRGKERERAEESFGMTVDVQIPVSPANKRRRDVWVSRISKGLLEVAETEYRMLKSSRGSRSKTMLDLSCSPMASNQTSADHDDKKSSGQKKKLKMLDLSCSRSPRKRNRASVDHDNNVAGTGLPSSPKRNSKNQKRRTYTRRIAYSEKQLRALERAEEVRCNLKSCHPSFVKSMIHSHVSSGFWLNLPTKFCKENLPDNVVNVVLEDEKGSEHQAIYIGYRASLSGGWRGFVLAHNLQIGDALVFELIEPAKWKIYIIKVDDEEQNEDFQQLEYQ